jgi:hypothetical protein
VDEQCAVEMCRRVAACGDRRDDQRRDEHAERAGDD